MNKVELGMDMVLRIHFLAKRLLGSSIGGHEHSTSKYEYGAERMAPIMVCKQTLSVELSFFCNEGMQMNKGQSHNQLWLLLL